MIVIFTYGSEGHPYEGGWTTVEAPNYSLAVRAFQAVHPNKEGDCLNCGGVYSENSFSNTSMAKRGNFGKFERERIKISVDVIDE